MANFNIPQALLSHVRTVALECPADEDEYPEDIVGPRMLHIRREVYEAMGTREFPARFDSRQYQLVPSFYKIETTANGKPVLENGKVKFLPFPNERLDFGGPMPKDSNMARFLRGEL